MLRDVKKVKNRRKQNFEGGANNMQLDKEDTRRSNLNGKCVFNILILLFVFIMFIPCEQWFLLRQTREKPLRATVRSFELTAVQRQGRIN